MSQIVFPPHRPTKHNCQMPGPLVSFDPVGTIRRCTECGRQWRAREPRIPGRKCLWVEWVPELRLSHWLRERREERQRRRWVPPTQDLPHDPPPPPGPTP